MEVLPVMTAGRSLSALVAVAFGAMTLSACETDPKKMPPKFRLEGSVGQVMDLGYDSARILLAPEDVSLLFVRSHPLGTTISEDGGTVDPMDQGTTEDYPLKVAYRLLGDTLDGGRLDLAALDSNGVPRGVAARNVANDPRTTLPTIIRGELFFDRPLVPDALVHGDFHVTFENGIEAASGRTAFSTSFTARVQP
jgi:hypothetical protein